ncbi:MAG TPA: hypothetical protein VK464_16185, partial [Symbiobacteriaceae bacterium]|nr:hypothetical protein [Symbiobacteriaceae bacterium]
MGVPLRKMRWLRALLVPILALSPFTAAMAAARVGTASTRPSGAVTVSALDADQAPAEVDAGLQAELAEGGKQTFLVKLKGDADVNGAAAKAQSRAVNQEKTPAKQRLARAQAVIESLHGVADKSQAGVVSLLDRMKVSGSVDEYERFWVVNAIAVTGDAKALEALARRPDVEKIVPSQTFHVMGGWDGAAGPVTADEAAAAGGDAQSIEW